MKPIKRFFLLPKLIDKVDATLDRLDLLLPTRQTPVVWSSTPAAIWRKQSFGGQLEAVLHTPPQTLDDILGFDRQKDAVVQNTEQFVRGLPSNNVLLTGARGTGKSSLIQALLNEYSGEGLRVIQVDKSDLADLMAIVSTLQNEPYRFILFCDDLSFESQDTGYKALKSALDGGVYASPENILIYATSNRRHLLPEYMADNTGASNSKTEIHHTEVVEEKVSLSDRFGLWVTFYPMNQRTYLSIACHWVEKMSANHQIDMVWNKELEVLCVRWADNRGSRSGRTAFQFAKHWVGQQLLTVNKP